MRLYVDVTALGRLFRLELHPENMPADMPGPGPGDADEGGRGGAVMSDSGRSEPYYPADDPLTRLPVGFAPPAEHAR